MNAPAPPVVHVVDDDASVRQSLEFLLGTGGFAVRLYDSARALLDAAPAPPGCVLTDVRMPGMDGIELLQQMRRRGVDIPVVVMTGHGDVPLAVRAMKSGAIDFLEKPFSDEALFAALRRAEEEGERRAAARARAAEAVRRIAALTPREREVFALLVQGLPTKAIANKLGASPRTIEVHRARVMEKLAAHSLPDLVRLWQSAEGGGQGTCPQ
ncbi:MAG TPA: response regulator FixJ [Acetobacteraceae bacterium]|nr:response regulator FixJ [Acetobacteraceae bacterium]